MRRSNALKNLWASLVTFALLLAITPIHARAQEQSRGVTNIVLVHGAWADGSSWSKVIPLLEAKGLNVVAVQLPLTSLADDVATLRRAITLVNGPLLLVAHSYGGVVITEAGDDPKVVGLVYVAAFAPQEGQSAFQLASANPTPVLQQLTQDADGFLKITPKGIREDFAQDLSYSEKIVLTAAQGPTAGGSLNATVSAAAWRHKPTWYLVASNDRVIAPTLQANFAQEMNAKSITLSSSHVAMLSRPYAVASFIRRAARGD